MNTNRFLQPFEVRGFIGRLFWPVLLCVLLMGSASRVPAQSKPIILKSVEISQQGDAIVVDLTADGALPIPATGRVESPPRYFLDFPGVIAGTSGSTAGRGPLKRVRVALNTASPPLTRVVLDLGRQPPVQIQGDERERGRIRLIIGSDNAPADGPPAGSAPPAAAAAVPAAAETRHEPLIPIPPAPIGSPASNPVRPAAGGAGEPIPTTGRDPLPPVAPLPSPAPPPAASAGASPTTPGRDLPPPAVYPVTAGAPASTPSAEEIGRYREQVEGPLNRIRALRQLLTEIDRQQLQPPDGLADARSEVSAAIRVLAAVHPPDSLKPTHDLLLRAASLSMMAATLRADAGSRADPTAVRNASSAAAGALLLMDRVCIELGCAELPRRQ